MRWSDSLHQFLSKAGIRIEDAPVAAEDGCPGEG